MRSGGFYANGSRILFGDSIPRVSLSLFLLFSRSTSSSSSQCLIVKNRNRNRNGVSTYQAPLVFNFCYFLFHHHHFYLGYCLLNFVSQRSSSPLIFSTFTNSFYRFMLYYTQKSNSNHRIKEELGTVNNTEQTKKRNRSETISR